MQSILLDVTEYQPPDEIGWTWPRTRMQGPPVNARKLTILTIQQSLLTTCGQKRTKKAMCSAPTQISPILGKRKCPTRVRLRYLYIKHFFLPTHVQKELEWFRDGCCVLLLVECECKTPLVGEMSCDKWAANWQNHRNRSGSTIGKIDSCSRLQIALLVQQGRARLGLYHGMKWSSNFKRKPYRKPGRPFAHWGDNLTYFAKIKSATAANGGIL